MKNERIEFGLVVMLLGVFISCVTVSAQTLPEKMNFVPGATWTVVISGTSEDLLDDYVQDWGPYVETFSFESSNLQIIDHTATMVMRDDFGDLYFMADSSGLYTLLDGNPNLNEWYEYYEVPKLFTPLYLAPGESVSQSGTSRGQWDDGLETWSGAYDVTVNHLGMEDISTQLGSYNAEVIEIAENFTITLDDWDFYEEGFSTFTLWVVDGVGIVKAVDEWIVRADWTGDGEWDEHWKDTTHFELIPEPVSLLLLGLGGIFLRSRPRQ